MLRTGGPIAGYLVDFCLNLYHSEVVDAESAEQAKAKAEELLMSDGFWSHLLDAYDDPQQTDWLVENVEVSVYGRTEEGVTVGGWLGR